MALAERLRDKNVETGGQRPADAEVKDQKPADAEAGDQRLADAEIRGQGAVARIGTQRSRG